MYIETALPVLGGFGLFIFGMKMMSNGLELAAGERMQNILQRATSNRFLAILFGIFATVALNSSTASTIMTVSFVNAGLLNLVQAIGIKLGANVGTTFSAQLVAFRIDAYAPIFIFVGVIMYMFFKKRGIKNIGQIALGFGLLFFGISVLSAPLRELAADPSFSAILTTFENPVLALLAGFTFTAIVQSSTAATGILVALHLSGVPIPFETSAFIILGVNIGTSITTLIASIPANRESKRAALFHIVFDIIGSIVFGTLIFLVPGILGWFQATWAEPARQVAMFHTLYNVATMVIFIPFVRQVAFLMEKLVPNKADDKNKTYQKKLIYLEPQMMRTPSVAVMNAHLELCRMGKIANENLMLALDAFFEKNMDKANRAMENEAILDYLNHNIASKIVLINNMSLSNSEAEKIGAMFQTLSDIERIGDHAENIAEYVLTGKEDITKISETAIGELKQLSEATLTLVTKALDAYEQQDQSALTKIGTLEEKVDSLADAFTNNHISRMKTKLCDPKSGVIFTDIIIDLERVGDHANNIAFSMLPARKQSGRLSTRFPNVRNRPLS